jgi:cytochrome b involved in lipid metabolism
MAEESVKTFTLEEVKKHNCIDDLWVAIEGRVYNVTKFLEDHPGGDGVLMDNAGTDATSEFHAVGHSDEAMELLKQYYVGNVAGATPKPWPEPKPKSPAQKPASQTSTKTTSTTSTQTRTPAAPADGGASIWKQLAVPVLVLAIGLAVRFYYS